MGNGIDVQSPLPLYAQIEKAIVGRIAHKEWKPGEAIGTHQQLAKEFGVSLITIKRAVSNLIDEGVLYTRVGKGTFVSERPSKKKDIADHKSIGLVLRDLKHEYFSLIVHSIEQRAYELGFNVLLSNSSGSIEKEESQISRFRSLGVDGLIIASLSLEYRAIDYIRKLHEEGFPYIMVSYIHDPDYWYVGTNHELGGYLATEHLISLGYKSIGYVHVGKGNLLSDVRKNGYTLALQEHDRPFDSRLIYYLAKDRAHFGLDRRTLGYDLGRQFLSLDPKPDALFVYSDVTALGLEQALLEQGLKVPDDVALVGFDDVALAQYAPVPLTTIHQPTDRIGTSAVDIIQKRIDSIDTGNRTIFKPELVIRDSCGAKKRGRV